MYQKAREWQFDGLVGPTHNYAGLAMGNVASASNAGAVSNPKEAALQGLAKMRFVRNLGVPQAFFPPHYRPLISELKRVGFTGTTQAILDAAYHEAPALLATVFSSSFMWTANAATISPSSDTQDGKIHITPANMASHYHRAIEAPFTHCMLSKIFHNANYFSVHKPLFRHIEWGDEGAANHMVSCSNHGSSGMHYFVYGESHQSAVKPCKFPARQQRIACEAIARNHRLSNESILYLQQSPAAIDLGVFHHDVIGMNTTRVMIVHEEALTTEDQEQLRALVGATNGMVYREVTSEELTVVDAVRTYLFNSQLLDVGQGRFVLIAPTETREHPQASALVQKLIAEGVIGEVHYLSLRESMRNGGGPACLRLRVVMTEEEAAAIHPGVIFTPAREAALVAWVERHYRDRLTLHDLKDAGWVESLNRAYLELEQIIEMPGLYSELIDAM